MENIEHTTPFEFNKPVTGKQFLNHNEALEEICSELRYNKKIVFVSGYQGYGNTSLALKVVEHMEKRYKDRVVIYVSLKDCKTEFQMLLKYIGSVVTAIDKNLNFKFGKKKYLNDRRGIAELPEKTAKRLKKKVVLILDDFDVITGMRHQLQIEELLNSVWSNQRWITTCLVMTKTSETEALTKQQGRPFYAETEKEFNGIQPSDWFKFISNLFKENNQSIGKNEVNHIIIKMNGIPRYIQSLSNYVYQTGKSKITVDDIDNTINDIIELERTAYKTKFNQFTKFQKRVLKSVIDGEPIVVPWRYAEKTMSALETVLSKYGEGYYFSDPFFEHYLKKQMVR